MLNTTFLQSNTLNKRRNGLGSLTVLLNDLTVMWILEPASKLRSLELMEQFFGIHHCRKNYYKIAPKCIHLKKTVEDKVINIVKAHYKFNYDLHFYDVTSHLPH